MKQMKNTKNHFAVVLDEYGGLRVIVTMNDLLEQLVGDLTDNNDEAEPEEPDIVKLDTPEDDDCEGIWVIRGVAPLGEVAEELNVELPTEKYDTMGGYVFSNYGIVPEDGTEFDIELEPLHVRVSCLASAKRGIRPASADADGRWKYDVKARRDALSVDFIPCGDFLAKDVWLTGPAAFVAEIKVNVI